MNVNIFNNQNAKKVDTERIKKIAEYVLEVLGEKNFNCNIALVDDKKIKELNFRFRKINSPTDVLAFSTKDIVISTETALRNAAEYNNSLYGELALYIIHGILHLLGYDDTTDSERAIMKKKETEILSHLNEDFKL